jgi:hypothetical protein
LHAEKAHGTIDYIDPDNESTFERFSTRIVRCRLARNARVTELNCKGPRSNAMGYQGFEIAVEVTVKEGDTSKQRGDLLENLAKRVLLALQYQHVSTEVRVTGCELDLVATDSQTSSRILVECKAYRDRSIPADVLTKILGNVALHDFDSGWLICTSRLGKDATGVLDKLRNHAGKSKLLRVYDPAELVKLLVATGKVTGRAMKHKLMQERPA